ncbi:MAG: shikimate dehydrogenase [bacterium]
MEKKITKLFLNPNEMAFRKIYWPLLENETLTTVFRPGKRLATDERGYREQQLVMARVIDSIGADWAGVPPEFDAKLSKLIRIGSVYAKCIKDLDENDFRGASVDIQSKEMLQYHLGVVYNLYPKEIGEDSLVTIIKFSYEQEEKINNMKKIQTIEELVGSGVMHQALQPTDNAHHFYLAPKYTLTLVEDDYPARTPAMWNAVYRTFEIDAVQNMFVAETNDSTKILESFKNDPKYLGGGFGVGFKDEAIAYLDEVDPIARKIGAVNIVVKNDAGKLVGHNTDGLGYAESLANLFAKHGNHCTHRKVVILGSGGTGSAIAFALAQRQMKVVILNRTVAKAETLAKRINIHFNLDEKLAVRWGGEELIATEILDADVIINVSTKGSAGPMAEYMPLASVEMPANVESIEKNNKESLDLLSLVPKTTIISDVVLRDGDTPFIATAKMLGFNTLDGIPMVVNQGVEAMWLVHGKEFEEKGLSKIDIFNVMKRAAGFK